jgi:hypothetical protein
VPAMLRPSRAMAPILLLCGSVASGCRETPSAGPTADLAAPHAPTETLSLSFEELYPTFLWRKSMSEGEKAQLWTRYRGRWVRWEGVIASITDKGLTIRHLLATTTFDVSLTCETNVLPTIKAKYAVGDRVRYVGLLESYDDIFRTMYLRHCAVLTKVPPGDLGIPADMSHAVLP